MSAAKHTPGPWRRMDDRCCAEQHYMVVDAKGHPLFDSINRATPRCNESEEHDMAAASAVPEMLQLLLEVQDGVYDADPVAHMNWLARVDAAILKALGFAS